MDAFSNLRFTGVNEVDLQRLRQVTAKILEGAPVAQVHQVATRNVWNVERRLGTDTVARLLERYRAGVPIGELMSEFEIGRTSIRRLLNKNQVTQHRPRVTESQARVLLAAFEAGESLNALARRFHLSPKTVRLHIDRLRTGD